MAEKHYRSFVKAFSWRLTGSLDTMVIALLACSIIAAATQW